MSKEKSLGAVLRRGRAIQQLTLRQVEEATQISNAYLSQLENDKIKKPSANVLYKLASLYKIELETLLHASGIIKDNPNKTGKLLPQIICNAGITSEEEQALLDYLNYLRFKKRQP